MSPIEWLCANAPGFSDLTIEEREAIMHFSLLWSFFEAEVLGTAASSKSILKAAKRWEKVGQLDIAVFEPSLSYFKDRYFKNNRFTEHFNDLRFRKNDNLALVEGVLKGVNTNIGDCVAALLIVVYRLRNNLFHGVKWAYGIQGQLDNFRFANTALMGALDKGQ